MGSIVFLYLSVVSLFSTVAGNSSLRVSQKPDRVAAIRGTSVNFICIFPFSQNGSAVKVQWKKEGEDGYLETNVDSRKIFGVKKKGSSFFQLLNVSFQDAGVYHCTVILQGAVFGTGPGSRLIVQIPPAELVIFSRNSTKHLTLVCETTAFYPKDFTLTWYKDGNQIIPTSGIKMEETVTIEKQNSGELYKVSSSIEDLHSAQMTSVYTCLVSHVTLKTSIIGTYTIPKTNTESGYKNLYLELGGYAAGGCAFLILLIIIGKQCQLKKKNGSKANLSQLGNLEDQMGEGAAGDNVAYVTLDLRNSNKTPGPKHQEERTVYAQTKRGAAADKLIYAGLDLTRSKQILKTKFSDKNSVYAETKRGAAADKLTYADLDLPHSKNTSKAKPCNKNAEYAEVNIRKYKAITVTESGTA